MKWINPSGTTFVFGSYRQRISQKSPGKIREYIKGELPSHGPYVALAGKRDVLFNSESGIAAGEFLLRQLDIEKYPNSIYCEYLDEERSLYSVVIVNSGKVVCDVICEVGVSNKDVEIELETSESEYTLILNEGVTQPVVSWMHIDPRNIISSKTNLFQSKVLSEDQKKYVLLTGLDSALINAGFAKKSGFLTPSLLVFVALGCAYVLLVPPKSTVKQEAQIVDPFKEYRSQILMGKSAVGTILRVIPVVDELDTTPGWKLGALDMNQSAFKATMINLGGTLAQFKQLKEHNKGTSFGLENGIVTIAGRIEVLDRVYPYVIYRLDEVEGHIFDEISARSQHTIMVLADVDKGNYVSRQYSISAQKVTFVDIENIAYALKNLPIIFDTISIKSSEIGYDITLTITALGIKG